MNKKLATAVALLACSLALPSLADEGRIPVHTAPTVISESGKYILTRNLLPVPGDPAIEITAPVVDLDLNGFLVDTTGMNQPAIHISAVSDVVIRDGSLVGGGIETAFSGGANRIVIEDVQIRDSYGDGMALQEVVHVELRRNAVLTAQGQGMYVTGVAGGSFTGIIEDNVVREAGANGMRLSLGRNLSVRGNQLENTGTVAATPGLYLSNCAACKIDDNTLLSINGMGIRMNGGTSDTFNGNVIKDAKDHGFYADSNVFHLSLVDNHIHRSTGDAILLDGADYAVLRNNDMIFNTGVGLNIRPGSAATVYYGNVARANCNGGGPVCPCNPVNVTDFCDEGAGSTDGGGNFMP